jgi:hypothetical protein
VADETHIDYSMKTHEFKGGFMDRGWVKNLLGPLAARALGIFGARVRQRAQLRIKDRDRQVSQAGEGPTNQTGLLREFIFFAFSPQIGGGLGGVVVGPAKLGGRESDETPKVLEFGGTVLLPVYRKTGRKTAWGNDERERAGDRIVRIAPRPYMMPAFNSVYPDQMPDIWERAASGR